MFKHIKQKYFRQRRLAEAKEFLKKRGYKLLVETPVADFEETDSKKFLLDVIDNLELHGYISKKEIDRLDDKEGYIWNQLNKLAKSYDIEKIINYLHRLGLYHQANAA